MLTSASEQGMPTSRSLILRQVGAASAGVKVVGVTVTPPASALLPASGVMIGEPPVPLLDEPPVPGPLDPPEPVLEAPPVPVPDELPVPLLADPPEPDPFELPVPLLADPPEPDPFEPPEPVWPSTILPLQP